MQATARWRQTRFGRDGNDESGDDDKGYSWLDEDEAEAHDGDDDDDDDDDDEEEEEEEEDVDDHDEDDDEDPVDNQDDHIDIDVVNFSTPSKRGVGFQVHLLFGPGGFHRASLVVRSRFFSLAQSLLGSVINTR